MTRIAVVGGGLAGLSAALKLKRFGYTVELYERSRLLGGKATSFEVDGVEVDNGQHVFLACCHEFIRFVEGLGLAMTSNQDDGDSSPLYLQPRFQALLLSRSATPVHLRAVDLPAPLHLSLALLNSKQLGIRGRFQVALALLFLRQEQSSGECFGNWLERHGQGSKALAGFWEPFVVPALNASLDAVSARDAAFVIRTAFLEQASAARFGYSRIPLGRIAGMVAPRLDRVRLRTAVVGIEFNGKGSAPKRNSVGLRLKDGSLAWYDGAVLAVPPERLKSILVRPKRLGVFGLDQFRDAAIVDIHLWYDVPPGTLLGGDLGFAALLGSPIQWVFEKATGRAANEETYLCCSMSAADQYVGKASQALVAVAQSELTAVLPRLADVELLRGAATRDRSATFVPAIGLIRPGAKTDSPVVTLAGAWTDTGWPATMESAVRSGLRAAEVLHDSIAA